MQAGDDTIVLSVVIPTYRRPDLLRRCLDAVRMQTMPPEAYEIIVADDGPDATTRAVVMECQNDDGPAVRYVPVTRTQGPAGARNAGWRSARGQIIAFTDDDTVPRPEWLVNGLAAMDTEVEAVSGRVEVPLRGRPTDHERDIGGLAHAEFVTANCFVRRSALVAVQGFDERYTMAWREDSDLQFALLRNGARIGRAEEAVVLHPVRPAPWGNSLRAQSKVFFDALLYRKYPRLYRQRIRPVPPLHYYLAGLCLVLAAVSALGDWSALLVASGLIWLAVTAWFCVKRLRGASHTLSHVGEMIFTSIFIPPLALYWRFKGALHFRVLFI